MNRRLTKLLLAVLAVLVAPAQGTTLRAADEGQKPPVEAAPPAAEAQPAGPDAKSAPNAKPTPEAAPARPRRCFEQPPYDEIMLDKENDNEVLKVMLLDLPGRRLPDKVKRVGKLKVKLLENPADDYEVAWRAVENIRFYEERVLREAEDVVRRGAELSLAGRLDDAMQQLDDAYDYYQYLLRYYPATARLQESLQAYLYTNAGVLFKKQHVAEAFAVLEELYRQNKDYQHQGGPQTVRLAMERVGDQAIKSYVDADNFSAARMLVERLAKDYGDAFPPVASWRTRLDAMAKAKRDEASAHLAAGRFREAHEASREMLKIWPRVEGGRELILEIASRYPLVVVGTSRPAASFDGTSLDDPPARRCGFLMYRTLIEFVERGPEGGAYASPWGTVQQSADRSELVFELRPQQGAGFTGYDLSRELLAMADPGSPAYRPSWAKLVAEVKVENVRRVQVKLRQPHVLPQALLQVRLDDQGPNGVRYRVAEQSPGETRFEPTAAGAAGEPSPVIVERFYAEPRKAIEDLRKGKLDAIDRLLPSDAQRLRNDESLHVGTYAFPSIHVLVPNRESPFLDNRVFRRALLYGINREVILNKGLLDGAAVEGMRVLSAPLPAGVTSNDPAAYAYDEAIRPLPYDPVMSAILLRLAEQQLAAAADKKQEKAPELKELVLAHPAGEMPRFICKQIQTQWNVIGVKCALRELPPGQSKVTDGKYDVLYGELMIREPLTDAARVFGPAGLVATSDPFLSLTLRRLDDAANWKDARDTLHELHRLLYEDVTLLPLFQMIDYFVYQTGLTGVQDRPIAFYQNVERWRVVPQVQQE